jgi:pimeloyl-ACP methyl ester carboxylesterase
VVALDLKGFGDSDKPMWRRSYRVDTLLGELKEFISALGVTSCTVIGHDLGAMLGWYLIHQYPEVVKKFVTIACPHPNVYWNELPTASAFNTRYFFF